MWAFPTVDLNNFWIEKHKIMTRQDTAIFNDNKFKLGFFAPNCSCGLAMTTVPERWDASWENNVALARKSEAAGFEFILPIARWHGYDGEEVTAQEETLETITWAGGLLALTEKICVFGTVHAPLINPVFAAKQIVTTDHIGAGRFGLNVVSGWNPVEFEMFGVGLREHEQRYKYTQEWIEVVQRIWSEDQPFDYDGTFFQLKGVVGRPKPFGADRPMIMSAGSSPAGRAFAIRHADCLFMLIVDQNKLATEIESLRTETAKLDRDTGVFASGHMVCRATDKEAEDYYNYYAVEKADDKGVEFLMDVRREVRSLPPELMPKMRKRLAGGIGTVPIVGSPDTIAETFRRFADAGLEGMALGVVNYLDELPFLVEELLPRMERLGLRKPVT
jgi:FMNH2-dependent dimethyl sulfone monooxygenase